MLSKTMFKGKQLNASCGYLSMAESRLAFLFLPIFLNVFFFFTVAILPYR